MRIACCLPTAVVIKILKLLSFVNPGSHSGREGGAAAKILFSRTSFKKQRARLLKIIARRRKVRFSGEGRRKKAKKKGFSEKGTRRRKSEVSTGRSQAATLTLFLGAKTNREATATCHTKFVSGRLELGAATRACVRVLSRDHLCESHLCGSIVRRGAVLILPLCTAVAVTPN